MVSAFNFVISWLKLIIPKIVTNIGLERIETDLVYLSIEKDSNSFNIDDLLLALILYSS